MILYYAIGGGIGHLARAAKFASYSRWENFLILTAYQAQEQTVFEESKIITVDHSLADKPTDLWAFLQELILSKSIGELYLDSFPCGILGELDSAKLNALPQKCSLYYVARWLNWKAYSDKLLQNQNFQCAFIVEELPETQKAYIQDCSAEIKEVNLPLIEGGNSSSKDAVLKLLSNQIKKDEENWLVLHSRPQQELEKLISYAHELRSMEDINSQLFVCTEVKDFQEHSTLEIDFIHFRYFPASDLLSHFDRLISAAGFNSMQEAKLLSIKHHFLPFPRRYDDQFARANRARRLK